MTARAEQLFHTNPDASSQTPDELTPSAFQFEYRGEQLTITREAMGNPTYTGGILHAVLELALEGKNQRILGKAYHGFVHAYATLHPAIQDGPSFHTWEHSFAELQKIPNEELLQKVKGFGIGSLALFRQGTQLIMENLPPSAAQ